MAVSADADPGARDFVDPQEPSPVRLSRKNILALVLTVVGVIMALFFGSRRGPEPSSADMEVPDYDAMPSISIGASVHPPQVPAKSYAGSGPPPVNSELRVQFDQARQSRPLVRTFGIVTEERETPSQAAALLTIRQSTVIEAALETTLNSKRAGPVVARVVRPVRDSEQLRHVLIPAGTKLTGTMHPHAGTRIVVLWTRMEFPDGSVRDLPDLPAMETTGEHGLAERVNHHRAAALGSGALMALLGGASTYAGSQAGLSGSLAGAALGMELSRSAHTLLQRNLGRTPTVTVRPGYRFLIYVTRDLHFDHPAAS